MGINSPKVLTSIFLSYLIIAFAEVGVREKVQITSKDKVKFTTLFQFFKASQKTPPTSRLHNPILDYKAMKNKIKDDVEINEQKNWVYYSENNEKDIDSLTLSLLQLSAFRGKNNTKDIYPKEKKSHKTHSFDFKIDDSPFFLDKKHKKQTDTLPKTQKKTESNAFRQLLLTVKQNSAKLISIITTQEKSSYLENNVLQIAKFIIILFLIGIAVYLLFLFIWILFGMVYKMSSNIRLIQKTNHYSLRNSILEGKEILKRNTPRSFAFGEAMFA